MTRRGRTVGVLSIVLITVLLGGVGIVLRPAFWSAARTHITAYFDNTNGLYPGDDILILGVRVGAVDTIEPQPTHARVTFWVYSSYKIPTDVRAAIISPRLVTARSIQLAPAYTSGPALSSDAVIPQERTAVPVEWDELRKQLQKLSDSLQPVGPDGISPLSAFITTSAANLRGQGVAIRTAILELAQAVSAVGDHSDDIFSTTKNLAKLVSALQSSTDLMRQLNRNLGSVTELLANDDNEVGQAVSDIDKVAGEVRSFVADNREVIGTTSDKLASTTSALVASLDDLKQALHVAPNTLANFNNIYAPAHASQTGVLALNQFANPIQFLCGAIEAASRLGAEQAAKLCVQYLAPIVKNRQYNFPPIGLNPVIGAIARPNEVTYSEDWMRPDYNPADAVARPAPDASPAAVTDPSEGLAGLMVPTEPAP